jgi:hypothetical protein
MKKVLIMVVLAALGWLATMVVVRRRAAEGELPVEGLSGGVPLAPVPTTQDMP